MQRVILLAALALSGCAYTADSVRNKSTLDLCEIVYERGTISGIPERNAQAELDRQGADCKKYLEMQERREANTVRCVSTPMLGSIYTTCR